MSELFRHATVESLAGPWKGSIKIGPFGSQLKREDMVEHGHKVYGQENVIADDWSAGDRRVSDAKFNALRTCELRPGDVVLSMMGTVGKCAVFPSNAEPGLMDSHLLRIQPNPDLVTREFLSTVLQAENVVGRQVAAMSHGSIMAGLSSSIVRRFTVPLPPLNEQPIVSVILDTLDTTIRKTEAIIAKLQQVKQGLLHDLLTRGIDANGELRPPQGQAPHLYKDSQLGWIPREWEAAQLGAFAYITKLAGYEYTNHFDYSIGGEVICVRVLNLKEGVLDLTDTQTIPRSVSQRLPRSQLHRDDLVLSYVGTIGEVARIPDDDRFHLAPNVAKITVTPDSVHAAFLAAYIAGAQGRKRLLNLATVTSQPSISMERVRQLQAPLPPLSEQVAISRALATCDGRIGAEQAQLACMAHLKSGLMDDLLTGRVRVTPLLRNLS